MKNLNRPNEYLKLYNVQGQLVASYENVSKDNLENTGIDISRLSTGVYILKIQLEDGSLLVKKIQLN